MRLISLILFCLVLLGCPKPPYKPVDPTQPSVQECKIEWHGPPAYKSYGELIAQIETELANTSCDAPDLLCIWIWYEKDGVTIDKLYKFGTIQDIPRTSLKNEDGYFIIEYLEEAL